MKDSGTFREESPLSDPRVYCIAVIALSTSLFAMAPQFMIMLAMGVIIAAATEPLVERLQRRLNMIHPKVFVSHALAATVFVVLVITGIVITMRLIVPLCIEGITQLIALIPKNTAWWQDAQVAVRTELEKALPKETVDHMLSRVTSMNTGQTIASYTLAFLTRALFAAEHILVFLGSWLFTLMTWKKLTASSDNTVRRGWSKLAQDGGWVARRFQENLATLCKMIVISGGIFWLIFWALFLCFGKSMGLSMMIGLLFGMVACIPTIGPLLVYPLAALIGLLLFVIPEFMSTTLVWTWPEVLDTLEIIWRSSGVWKWFFLMIVTVITHFLESWAITPYFMERHLKINAMYLMAVLGSFVYFAGLTKGVVFGLGILVLFKSWDEFQDYKASPASPDVPDPTLETVEQMEDL